MVTILRVNLPQMLRLTTSKFSYKIKSGALYFILNTMIHGSLSVRGKNDIVTQSYSLHWINENDPSVKSWGMGEKWIFAIEFHASVKNTYFL